MKRQKLRCQKKQRELFSIFLCKQIPHSIQKSRSGLFNEYLRESLRAMNQYLSNHTSVKIASQKSVKRSNNI